MVSFEAGKLYVCSRWHLLVFPTEEKASESVSASAPAAGAGAVVASGATYWSAWWSEYLKCHVSVIPGGRVFCVVEEMGGETRVCRQVHVVAGEAVGWINIASDLGIREVKG